MQEDLPSLTSCPDNGPKNSIQSPFTQQALREGREGTDICRAAAGASGLVWKAIINSVPKALPATFLRVPKEKASRLPPRPPLTGPRWETRPHPPIPTMAENPD